MIRSIHKETGESITVSQPLDGDDGSVVIEIRDESGESYAISLEPSEAEQVRAWIGHPNDALVLP